ncbi:hypothetical protein, conserved [Leishmania tarentolae]|uniref:AAA+ ATPase domain-containing protein n=1 Tax=Leishmania tarentolae TaxID=5689 RepID=A0A640KGE3_LEITA|nr:hypothetical protein, conserved [Leishmania tarentolae]
MVGAPPKVRHGPTCTPPSPGQPSSMNAEARRLNLGKHLFDDPNAVPRKLNGSGCGCRAVAPSIHASATSTVDHRGKESATERIDATRKAGIDLNTENVYSRSSSGSSDSSLPHPGKEYPIEILVRGGSVGLTRRRPHTLAPALSEARRETECCPLGGVMALSSASLPQMQRGRAGYLRQHNDCEKSELALQNVTCVSDEDMGESQGGHKQATPPPSIATAGSISASSHPPPICEVRMSPWVLCDDDEGDEENREGLPVQQPHPQRRADRTVHRHSSCFSSLDLLPTRTSTSSAFPAATDNAEVKQHLCDCGDADKGAVPHFLCAAPILQVSGLREFFTYGVQAAMRHYSEHLNGAAYAEEDGTCSEINDSARARCSDHVTSPATLPANVYGTRQRSTASRYCNAFLEESSNVPKYDVGTTRNRTRADSCSSNSSNAGTYDSDVERSGPPSPRDDTDTCARNTCLLTPQQTSLFRAPLGAAAERYPPAQGVMADGSWLATTATSSSPTTLQKSSPAPSGSVKVADQQRDNSAQVLFREALQHAYQCEDAHRQRRRAQVDKQQEQLLRGVQLLQGASLSSSAALLAELLPSRGRDGRRSAGLVRSPVSPQQQPSQPGVSPLSHLSTSVEAAAETGTETLARQGFPKHVSTPLAAEAAHIVENNEGGHSALGINTGEACVSSSKAAATPQMGDIAKRLLQVMSPVQAQRLHRPLNPFIEALLRHYQNAQLQQRAARHAEDQVIHAKRTYELPVLTEDVVRYAALLLCLRRRKNGGGGTAVTHTASAGGSGVLQPGSASKELKSTTLNAVSPSSPTLAAADPAAALPFGEDGTLLYLKYPPPLLRTTSFAVETVRLLKWLRTWKKSGPSVSGETGDIVGGGSNASVGGVSDSGNRSSSSSKSRRKIGRKRMRSDVIKPNRCHGNVDSDSANGSDDDGGVIMVTSPTRAPYGAASNSPPSGAVPPSRSTVEHVSREAQHAVELQERQMKQEKRSNFLKFFGAAASAAAAPPPTKGSGWKAKAAQGHNDCDGTATDVVERKTVPCLAMSESPGSNTAVRDAAAISVSSTYGITSSMKPFPTLSGETQRKASTPALASHAYQLYCHAWKHVVKSGITPLAVVANAFCGPKAITGRPRPSNNHDHTTGAAADSAKDASWTDGAVPRVCARLPFFKEMREEARRTALGSANNGTYYEDAFGNRLRSARLAKKEQEKQELLVARQRRRAKKKGYFHRDDDYDSGFGGRVSNNGASAMLEAMLQSSATCGSEGQGAERGTKRRRSRGHVSSDDSSEVEGVMKDTKLLGSNQCAGARRTCQLRSRASSSYSSSSQTKSRSSSSSTASMVSAESDQDEAGTKDELTNIAVVSGPTGSGKTAAVYVAAQLLGFHVVEMNASVRRCSKTVEHLLAELTRSHRLSGLRSGTAGGFNAEEELAKLKQQHAVMMERARAEAEAAERKAELKRREALKTNGISVQAVANFFAKGSGRAVVPSSKTAKDAKGKDAVKVLDTRIVDEVPAPAVVAVPGTPVDAGTLLLFEDADVLLGDESAKPFYAAIRDLAHRSKVPIVVTVSSDPAAAQRYDTEPFLSLVDGKPPQVHMQSASPASAVQPTYWQLCNAVGLNSTMTAMEAAYQALQVETDPGNRGTSTPTTATTTASAHDNNWSHSAVSYSGGSAGTAPVSGSPAASLLSPFSSASGGGVPGSAAPTACVWTNGASTGASTVGASGGGGGAGGTSTATSAAAAAVAARYTHMLLNPTLVASFFGSQTPFTVVDPLQPSALYAQLLAVGAVELDLLRLDEPATSPGDSNNIASLSSSSSQQELERMATRLTIRDTDIFLRLAEHLRHHIFGAWDIVDDGAGTFVAAPLLTGDNLLNALQCDAAHRTTTDVRYWLNKLQVLLLSLRAGSGTARMPNAAEAATTPESITRKRSRDTMKATSPEPTSVAHMGDSVVCDANVVSTRRAEHLVEAEFQHRVSLAASEWDSALGQHVSNVAHNEQHSARYEHWFLDTHVHYISDVVEELSTIDHPTARVNYTTPLQAPPSPSASTQPGRCGRRPSSSPGKKIVRARNAEITASAAPEPTHHQREGVSTFGTPCTRSSSSSSGGGVGGGLSSVWRSFFAASGASGASASSTGSPVLRGVSSADPRQQALFGGNGSKEGGMVVGASPPPCLAIPARYEWPPSALELRRQACNCSHLRPVELLLPYGAAEAYYSTAAASTSALTPFSIHDMVGPDAALLGHELTLRFLGRRPVRDSSTSDNGKAEEDVGREFPAGVRTTQEERFSVFRRWWCRTRKAGALRDSVAGRSAETLEDILGFGCLLTPFAAATRNTTFGSP